MGKFDLESELKKSEEKYRSIVEYTSDAILLVDTDFKVLEWNKGAENLYGYKREEVLVKFIPIISKIRLKELHTLWEKLRKGELVQNFETQRLHKDGHLIDVVLTLSAIKDKNNNIKTISGIARDISEQKILQKQIQQAEKLAGIGRLAAGIAHQLNTPLGSINLSAQMLEDAIENVEYRDDIKKIIRQTEYCKNIINKLLAFSRPPGEGKTKIHLNRLINNVVKLLEKEIKDKNIEVKKTLSRNNDKIYANSNQIEQIFFNLLSNAIDAVPKGGKIGINTKRISDKEIEVKINDNGTGIKAKDIPMIFEPFFTTKKIGHGTGLGLSICYGLVEEQNGTIKVKSKVGKGTTFALKFPLVLNKPK